jgi:hypothetical protein
MRKLIASLMLSALALGAFADIVSGNGQVKTERRSLPAFRSIGVSGSGILRVHRGGQKVEITSDSNILGYITTEVVGGELKIGFRPFTSILKSTKLEYDVTLPELTALRLAGSGDAYLDAFKGGDFKASVAGSGGVKADLEYGTVTLDIAGSGGFDATVKAQSLSLGCAGSGDAYIKGSASSFEARISGSGTLGARGLATDEAKLTITGSGQAEIRVSKRLEAALSGSGSLRYWGRPAVSQRISGSGRVSQAGD